MPPQAKPDLTKEQKGGLTKAQRDALDELFTLHKATTEIKVGYQTLNAAYRTGALHYAARLDIGDKRQGKDGLPLFTKAELIRWNRDRKNKGLTVDTVDQFLANADPAVVQELLAKYRPQTT